MKWLVTGAAGFIGSNFVRALCRDGEEVIAQDTMLRPENEPNAAALQADLGIDVCADDSRSVFNDSGADVVAHLGANSKIPLSIEDPMLDFEANVVSTLHLLEAIRAAGREVKLLFASSNKVYGDFSAYANFVLDKGRWLPTGCGRGQPATPTTPYGVSKAACEWYIREYCRAYGLSAAIFRMSCVYGPWQRGSADQGWVTHFMRESLQPAPRLTIYGDGCQTRDVMYVDDVVSAYRAVAPLLRPGECRLYDLGGGADNIVSLHEVIEWCELQRSEGHIQLVYQEWRSGDQKGYYCDISRIVADIGLCVTPCHEGFRRTYEWVRG